MSAKDRSVMLRTMLHITLRVMLRMVLGPQLYGFVTLPKLSSETCRPAAQFRSRFDSHGEH
eukprot:17778-Prorocentrum_minimum.AAC.1